MIHLFSCVHSQNLIRCIYLLIYLRTYSVRVRNDLTTNQFTASPSPLLRDWENEVRGHERRHAHRTERDRCPQSKSDRPLIVARRAAGVRTDGARGEKNWRVVRGRGKRRDLRGFQAAKLTLVSKWRVLFSQGEVYGNAVARSLRCLSDVTLAFTSKK